MQCSKTCQCPICRFARKELTPSEFAWYLKGCLEKESVYLKAIQEASSLEELQEKFSLNQYNIDFDQSGIAELVKTFNLTDPAFPNPTRFDYSKD